MGELRPRDLTPAVFVGRQAELKLLLRVVFQHPHRRVHLRHGHLLLVFGLEAMLRKGRTVRRQ